MPIKYLVKSAKRGWELLDDSTHKAKLVYFVIGPAGTVIVPAYYGVKGLEAARKYVFKKREREPREGRLEKDLNEYMGSE